MDFFNHKYPGTTYLLGVQPHRHLSHAIMPSLHIVQFLLLPHFYIVQSHALFDDSCT
ncbi:hypothetical protein B0J17DRAFT_685498 [Rhizoctonia solani]|nr:hypothetical protein B0J17DRAFT_685498 [Rhizoctonia solani]